MHYEIMKIYLLILLSIACLNHGFPQCDSIALVNKKIIEFSSSKINKKVGTGECWDLAKFALEYAGAKWDGLYGFGRKLEKGECIMPGDIIQFEKVKVKWNDGQKDYLEQFPHHTAVIYSVSNNDQVQLIHQNTGYNGKKVTVSPLNFKGITSGKYIIFRPVN
jgi:hypothetical protein